jgi:hypothetical protein
MSEEEIEKHVWLNADKSLRDIHAGIKEKYGVSMSLKRISEIRKEYFSADQPEETRERRSAAFKEVSSVESIALSNETEKIAAIAFNVGAAIAKRHLDIIDYEMSHGSTPEFIADEVMQWYEKKYSTLAENAELKTKIEQKDKELSAAYAMNLPNFKYWLRTRILERYANQVLQARMRGARISASSLINAMQTDLLRLEGDFQDLFK